MSARGRLRALWQRLEPWYDWSKTNVFRLDQVEQDFSDESEGAVRRIELQWFGVHVAFEFGPVPPKVTPDEIALRKQSRFGREAVDG